MIVFEVNSGPLLTDRVWKDIKAAAKKEMKQGGLDVFQSDVDLRIFFYIKKTKNLSDYNACLAARKGLNILYELCGIFYKTESQVKSAIFIKEYSDRSFIRICVADLSNGEIP